MNLFIDTNYKLQKDVISKLLNIISLEVNIIQFNVSNVDEIIKIIGIINKNNSELINKIKIYLNDTSQNISLNDKNILTKLCLLYFYGGIFISSNICTNNFNLMEKIYLENNICIVKSIVNPDNIFGGIISSKKYDTTLLNIIERTIDISTTQNIHSLLINNNNITFLTEQIILDKSNIYYNGDIIAEHYFKNINLLERFKIDKDVPKNLLNIKIGITIPVPENLNSFYSNGIRQNCLYLYELLKNMNYEVKLIIDSMKYVSVLDNIDFYKFEYISQNDVFMHNFDLIFSMGFSFPHQILKCLKNTGIKNISYVCGNTYLVDSERILYSQHKNRNIHFYDEIDYDQIWIIPQGYKQNKCYYEILTKKQCIQAPFIWSPMSIKLTSKVLNLDDENKLLYSKKKSHIGIFEPNLSIIKWALPCLLIAENTHCLYKNIEHVYVTNLNKDSSDINYFNMKQFNNICSNLQLFKEKKISSESRYNTLEFMSKHCDIAISHQWENPLNYLYLELAWMGWPILHNAHLCKDVGYYYEEFNYIEASELLNNIILNHSTNADEYIRKNREIIDRYLPTNKELQDKYRKMINDVFYS